MILSQKEYSKLCNIEEGNLSTNISNKMRYIGNVEKFQKISETFGKKTYFYCVSIFKKSEFNLEKSIKNSMLRSNSISELELFSNSNTELINQK